MPRYVILRHETAADSPRPAHWDLLLETGAVLATWALPELPVLGNAVAATRLADHRSDYLAYEGPLSENRGSVSRWDAGQYCVESETVRIGAETSVVFRSAKERPFREAKDDPATVMGIDAPILTQWRLDMRGHRLDGILVLQQGADEMDRWMAWLEVRGSSRRGGHSSGG